MFYIMFSLTLLHPLKTFYRVKMADGRSVFTGYLLCCMYFKNTAAVDHRECLTFSCGLPSITTSLHCSNNSSIVLNLVLWCFHTKLIETSLNAPWCICLFNATDLGWCGSFQSNPSADQTTRARPLGKGLWNSKQKWWLWEIIDS